MTLETTHPKDRIDWLTENYDLSRRNAEALILAELGYSHSGIANKIGVTQSTAKKYLSKLESEIGEHVTETLPKSVKYPTFPDSTPKSDVEYSGNYINISDEQDNRDLSPNKGVELSEISPELMSLNIDIEV